MELTRCPQLNGLIRAVEAHLAGSISADDLKQSLREMEGLYMVMWQAFQQQLKFQERTSPAAREAPRIEGHFKALRKGLEEVRAWFQDRRDERLTAGLEASRAAMQTLFAAFDLLSAEEERAEKLSPSPFMHHVLRVGNGVVRGTLPPEAFREILMQMKEMHRAAALQVERARPVGPEVEVQPQMKKLMDRIYAGFKEAELYFTDQQVAHIQKGLEAARVATQELHDLHATLARAAERTKACFKCGRDNPLGARSCVSCGFRFPAFVMEAEGSVDVSLEDGQIVRPSGAHVATEMTERLSAAVEKVQRGGATSDYLKVLDDVSNRVTRGKADFSRLAMPSGTQPEETEFLVSQKQVMEEGLRMLEEGLERLRIFAADSNPDHLVGGLETALGGSDRLAQVQAVSQALQQQRS